MVAMLEKQMSNPHIERMCRYIESDANQRILEQLRNDMGKII